MAITTRPFRRSTGSVRNERPPLIPMVFFVIFLVSALLAPWIAPHDPLAGELADRLKPPAWSSGGDGEFWLGTDRQGRDILSRLIHGARISLIVTVVGVVITGIVGSIAGLLSGYLGGFVDTVSMRLVDVSLSLPGILLAMLLAVAFEPSATNVIIVVALVYWASYARIVRAEALAVRSQDYVAYAKAAGCSTKTILIRHVARNALPSIMVVATLQVGQIIMLEAGLSFLGVGLPPPTPSWGVMISEGRGFIETAWWISILPGFAILAVVIAANLLGDWVRDRIDPRLRMR